MWGEVLYPDAICKVNGGESFVAEKVAWKGIDEQSGANGGVYGIVDGFEKVRG